MIKLFFLSALAVGLVNGQQHEPRLDSENVDTPTVVSVASVLNGTSALVADPASGQVGDFKQCGGEGYTGSTVCDGTAVCTYVNIYYSHCVPTGTSNPASTPVTTPPSTTSYPCTTFTCPSPQCYITQPAGATCSNCICNSTPTSSVSYWGQCGGQGYTGTTTCPGSATCASVNLYYSHCAPPTGLHKANPTANAGSAIPTVAVRPTQGVPQGPPPAAQVMRGKSAAATPTVVAATV